MLIELKSLESNPTRDFAVDPLDEDRIKQLTKSIKETDFWGGVTARRVRNGTYQIVAGHHRVRGAIAAGLREADLCVLDLDDAGMARVYAQENLTQRGASVSVLAGAVAAAIRVIAKTILSGGHVSGNPETSAKSLETQRGMLESRDGIGQDAVERFLRGIPGVTGTIVEQQLANLKASGDYARIIHEVRDELEAEHRDALKALAKAEREKAEADKRHAEAEKGGGG